MSRQQLSEEHVLQLVCTVELPYAVVAIILLDEALEDLSGDKLGDLGENILAVVHNQWFAATKLRTHFKSRLSKN